MAISLPIVSSFDAKGVNEAQAALKRIGSFAADIAKVAATAVVGIGVAGVREFAQFETSFARIQGLVGVTEGEIQKLQDAARTLGPQFGRSANEAADALFFITSAGLRGADAITVLEASLKASAIGLGSVNEIANVATASVNTYGSEVLNGAQAVEALAEAVRLGQFAPEELAGSLGRVIPISAELGVTFQETTGLIAALTRGGLSATEAVTGVRGAMQAVLKPTQEAGKLLEQYGFTTDEVRQAVEEDGFLDTMIRLREAFGENEEDFTRVIGSIEGLNAVLSLTGENVATNTDIVAQMGDDVLIMGEAMEIVADTSAQKFDTAMETSRNILLGIGEDLTARLLPYLDEFAVFMEENGPAIQQGFDNIFGAVEEVVGKFEDFFENLQEDPEFIASLGEMQEGFEKIGEKVGDAFDEVLKLVEQGLPIFVDELNENAIPAVDGLIDSLTTLLFFVNEVLGVFDLIPDELDPFVTAIERAINPVGNLGTAFQKLADGLNAAEDSWKKFKRAGAPASLQERIEFGFDATLRSLGLRANGGSVMGKSPYIVGERGPELFVPQTAGNIVPNNRLGGGATYNITVNAGIGTDGPQVAEQIVRLIRRYERNSGPVFARA